tara:strand:+ start:2367 stop:2768 length:402 start_codon:yes stop_codon:yes gene_type:complete
MSFNAEIAKAISQALKECPLSREEVAAEMGAILGQPSLSKAMLDRYSSETSAESNCGHNIPLDRFVAVIQVTQATWMLDKVAEKVGCTVLESEENRLAQLGYLNQEVRKLKQMIANLEDEGPVTVSRRKGWPK